VDHVGIYVGKGFFVHASFTNGVHIDSVQNPYYYQRLVSVRKYRGF
jgi:cell wall-associated NlpC family hydrolase